MVPRARKNTTLDPSANPFRALGEASPDLLSMAGGPRPPVVVESRTPSLFGASPSPFTGEGAGPLPFAANPPTAKHPRSDTSYLPGFTSESDPKSYWVQRFAAAAAAQENPSMDALITTIAGFLAEIQADYLARTDKLQSAIEFTESSGVSTVFLVYGPQPVSIVFGGMVFGFEVCWVDRFRVETVIRVEWCTLCCCGVRVIVCEFC